MGRDQGNLPKLLRRLAKRIDDLPTEAMVLHVTISSEVTDRGDWFSATVYYGPGGWAQMWPACTAAKYSNLISRERLKLIH